MNRLNVMGVANYVAKQCCLNHESSVNTVPGAHPAFYPTDNGGSFPRCKAAVA